MKYHTTDGMRNVDAEEEGKMMDEKKERQETIVYKWRAVPDRVLSQLL